MTGEESSESAAAPAGAAVVKQEQGASVVKPAVEAEEAAAAVEPGVEAEADAAVVKQEQGDAEMPAVEPEVKTEPGEEQGDAEMPAAPAANGEEVAAKLKTEPGEEEKVAKEQGDAEKAAKEKADKEAAMRRQSSTLSMSWTGVISMATVAVAPFSNYTFLNRQVGTEEEVASTATPSSTTVYAVLLTHSHRHPHVIIEKGEGGVKLVGGRLTIGEGELEGLRRLLTDQLAATNNMKPVRWEVVDLLSQWYRGAEGTKRVYPYLPCHRSKPWETIKVYLVRLPSRAVFYLKDAKRLQVAACYDLHNNAKEYGDVLSTLPVMLGKYNYQYIE